MFGQYENVTVIEKVGLLDLPALVNQVRTGGVFKNTILKLHQIQKKVNGKSNPAYDSKKKKLPAITPNAIYGLSKNDEDFVGLSGFMFFDIDGDIDIDVIMPKLLELHADKVCFASRSVGGKGVSFYIKCHGLTKSAFKSIYKTLLDQFEQTLDVKLDSSCVNLNRLHIIPFDPNCYYNPDVLFDVTNVSVVPFDEPKRYRDLVYIPPCSELSRDTFSRIDRSFLTLPNIKDLYGRIQWESYRYDGEEDYIIKPVEYFRWFIPKKLTLKDGEKRTYFFNKMIGIIYCNPDFTVEDVASIINWINQKRLSENDRMEFGKLMDLVQKAYYNIKTKGIKPNTQVRYAHLNKSKLRTAEERRQCGRKLQADWKTSVTRARIADAIFQLKSEGKKVTNKVIANMISKSEVTVKRNRGLEPILDVSLITIHDIEMLTRNEQPQTEERYHDLVYIPLPSELSHDTFLEVPSEEPQTDQGIDDFVNNISMILKPVQKCI